MTVPTHIVLGRAIHQLASTAMPIELNTRWFLYGNIYPDLSHYRISLPHYAQRSMPFVQRMIHTLCQMPLEADGRLSPIQSLQLGMLCHYICDFFCHAHSPAFKGTLRAHLAYEFKQQGYITRHPYGISRKYAHELAYSGEMPADADAICCWLDRQQARYRAVGHRPVKDLELAVRNSSLVLTSILAVCLENAQGRAQAGAVAAFA